MFFNGKEKCYKICKRICVVYGKSTVAGTSHAELESKALNRG